MTLEADPPASRFARGQALRLPKHPEHCSDPAELADLVRRLRASPDQPLLAADLFSGAGGMSLGLEQAGMRVVFGADFDADALATHAHHFAGMSVDWDLGDPERVEEVGAHPPRRRGSTSSPAGPRASRSPRPVAPGCGTSSSTASGSATTSAATSGSPTSRSFGSPAPAP